MPNLLKGTAISVSDDGWCRLVSLNRPEARNAMTAEMVAELRQVFAETASDPGIRVMVLRGAGGHFCAGGDLKSMMASGAGAAMDTDEDPIAAMNRRFGQLLREAEQLPQVLITVLEGAVLGGGLGLACVSDIAFAQADAKLGMPETTRGLPPAQIAPFVVTRIGLTAARRMALTGAILSGREARRLGLVHEVFEDEAGLDALLAAELAAIRRCAPRANALTKSLMLKVGQQEMDALLDEAATTFAASVRGREAAEGLAAFMQKRPAAWTKGA
jgi:isohexenylglutaconyl-CoA hydratase